MPLKEIKDPDKPKTKSESGKKAQPKTDDDPWQYLEDGTKVRQGRRLPYEKQLHKLFKELAGAVTLADSFSGNVIKLNAEELAYGYAYLAQENDAVRAFFARITDVSAHSAIIVPTACTVIPILWHFGLIPSKFGVPATLAAGAMPFTREQEQKYKADVKREQEQAERQARATHPQGEGPGDGDESND